MKEPTIAQKYVENANSFYLSIYIAWFCYDV